VDDVTADHDGPRTRSWGLDARAAPAGDDEHDAGRGAPVGEPCREPEVVEDRLEVLRGALERFGVPAPAADVLGVHDHLDEVGLVPAPRDRAHRARASRDTGEQLGPPLWVTP